LTIFRHLGSAQKLTCTHREETQLLPKIQSDRCRRCTSRHQQFPAAPNAFWFHGKTAAIMASVSQACVASSL